jgi:hypothetical protein
MGDLHGSDGMVGQAKQPEATTMTMMLRFDEHGDAAAVLTDGEVGPDDTADVRWLDSDRIARYDEDGRVIEYQFFNVRRYGVRIDDLDRRHELASLFRDAGIQERDWSVPIKVVAIRRRNRDIPAGSLGALIELKYDETTDGAQVAMRPAIQPEDLKGSEQLDADRIVRFDDAGHALMYSFLNVKRIVVRLDDLEHREELAALFIDAGFQERDWSHPISTKVIRRRDRAG